MKVRRGFTSSAFVVGAPEAQEQFNFESDSVATLTTSLYLVRPLVRLSGDDDVTFLGWLWLRTLLALSPLRSLWPTSRVLHDVVCLCSGEYGMCPSSLVSVSLDISRAAHLLSQFAPWLASVYLFSFGLWQDVEALYHQLLDPRPWQISSIPKIEESGPQPS